MPGSGKGGQRPVLWATRVVTPGLATSITQHESCTTCHWCVTSKHRPDTGEGGGLGQLLWQQCLNQHQQRDRIANTGCLAEIPKVHVAKHSSHSRDLKMSYISEELPLSHTGLFFN